MRKTLIVLLGFVSLGSIAYAKVLPCASDTLTNYIALGPVGCTVGQVTFANFAYSANASGGAPKISPDQIKVSPAFAVPDTGGFVFYAPWGVKAGQTQDSIIKYTVVGPPINTSGALMLLLGTHSAGPDSRLGVKESTNQGNLQVYENCVAMCRSVTSATLPFMPATAALQVSDHVKLSASKSSATLGSFTASFNYCAPCA